jgi:antirestriction protein ArdC
VYGSAAATRVFSEAERKEWRDRKRREADAALEEIVAMFESGELPSLVAETMIARAEGSSPMASWSLGNQLLAVRAGTTDARGFRQWHEVGRHVRKGARCFRILAPVLVKREEPDAETGESREESRVIGYRLIPVFRVQDTEGMALESPVDYRPAELPPLYDVAERLGLTVDYMPGHELAGFRGFYSPGRREISLLTHDVSTFFHELAHAAHDAVLRADGRTVKDVPAADLEIVAETVAATLCRLFDYNGYVFEAAKYVESFAQGGNPGRAAMRVLGDVAKVLYLLLDPPEWAEAVTA